MLHDHDVPKLSQPKMSAAEVNLFLTQVKYGSNMSEIANKIRDLRRNFKVQRSVE